MALSRKCGAMICRDSGRPPEKPDGTAIAGMPTRFAGAVKTLSELIARHHVRAIAIGNGTGSREAGAFVRDFLSQAKLGT